MSTAKSVEVPTKRVKLNNLDPLEILHPDVFERIFQHFESKDILSALTVSPSWCQEAEKSAKCMEKLQLRIGQKLPPQLIRRKYQNISLWAVTPKILQILRRLNCRRINIDDVGRLNLRNVLKIVEPVAEHLRIRTTACSHAGCKPRRSKRLAKTLLFPKLTKLSLTCHNCEEFEECTNLKELELMWKFSCTNIENILANNVALEKLAINRGKPSILKPGKFHFKLKEFSFCNDYDCMLGARNDIPLLANFLVSQAESLEKLTLSHWCGLEVFKIIFRMPKLT